MRIRTQEEKIAMGLLSPIFREMSIKLGSRGSIPLTDLICYSYANPEVNFEKTMEVLLKGNSYIGVKKNQSPEEIEKKAQKRAKEVMLEAIANGDTTEEVREKVEEELIHMREMLTEEAKGALYPSIKRCIATALERSEEEVLSKYGLKGLTIILKDGNQTEEERIKSQLLDVIGQEYSKYETYEERITMFFATKILEYMRKKGN